MLFFLLLFVMIGLTFSCTIGLKVEIPPASLWQGGIWSPKPLIFCLSFLLLRCRA